MPRKTSHDHQPILFIIQSKWYYRKNPVLLYFGKVVSQTKLLSHKLMIALLIGWLSLVIDFHWSFRWSYIWKEWDVFSISSLLKLRVCNQALKLYLIMQLLNDWDLIANSLYQLKFRVKKATEYPALIIFWLKLH